MIPAALTGVLARKILINAGLSIAGTAAATILGREEDEDINFGQLAKETAVSTVFGTAAGTLLSGASGIVQLGGSVLAGQATSAVAGGSPSQFALESFSKITDAARRTSSHFGTEEEQEVNLQPLVAPTLAELTRKQRNIL